MEPTSQIINNCVTNVSQDCQGALQRTINELNFSPPESLDLKSLEIPEEYSVYEIRDGESENFLLYDSGPNIDRILIFGMQSNIERFMDTTTLFMDGTQNLSDTILPIIYHIWDETWWSGLQNLYNNDAMFALQARMITSLAFVLIADLEEAVEELGYSSFWTGSKALTLVEEIVEETVVVNPCFQ
ncbi:hypothetical protein QE152_g24566 [Popillia japonica]|uniref:Uncharacterized protein n=1 Tax=Popillia japonica TaxID=7064 RepID=A0AAW1KDY3_POPJA